MARPHLVLALAGLALFAGCLGGADEPNTPTSSEADAPPGAHGDDPGNATGNATDAANATTYAPGWPDEDEAEVRPGVRVAGGCTSNFVFASPDNRTLYLGTAGHCVSDHARGDSVGIADGTYEGRLAYAADEDDPFLDFALVEIPEDLRDEVHPAVLHYGGPVGPVQGVSQGDRVLTFGNTSYREQAGADRVDPREGYVTEGRDRVTEVYVAPPSIPGDSGSGVLRADGAAVGVLVQGRVEAGGTPCVGCNAAMNLDVARGAAADAGVPVELKTWSLDAEPTLPGSP